MHFLGLIFVMTSSAANATSASDQPVNSNSAEVEAVLAKEITQETSATRIKKAAKSESKPLVLPDFSNVLSPSAAKEGGHGCPSGHPYHQAKNAYLGENSRPGEAVPALTPESACY